MHVQLRTSHHPTNNKDQSLFTNNAYQQQQQQQQQPFYGSLSRTMQVSRYQKKHSPTHHPDHPIFISFFYLPRYTDPPCSNYVLCNLFAQPLSMSSLVYLLVWSLPPHIPYISSPNHCLLFTTHAHTIATCFALVSILYHLFLVFLSTPCPVRAPGP